MFGKSSRSAFALAMLCSVVAGCDGAVLDTPQPSTALFQQAVLATKVDEAGVAVVRLPNGSRMQVTIPKEQAALADAVVGQPVDLEIRTTAGREAHGVVTRFLGPTAQAFANRLPLGGTSGTPLGSNAQDGEPNRVRTTQSTSAAVVRSSVSSANIIYVDATSGDDANDGRSDAQAFRTIARAMRELPQQVTEHYVIALAAGTYPEGLSFRRFVMPSEINNQQVKEGRVPAAISLVGADMTTTTLAPSAGTSCIDASSVVIYLQDIGCSVSGASGIVSSGGSFVIDNVAIDAPANASNGLYAEQSWIAFGGDFRVTGPFSFGMSIRTNSYARTGTFLNPARADLFFSGMRDTGVFLRDGGNLTNAFEKGTFTIENSKRGYYGILDSKTFLSTGIIVTFHNVGSTVELTQNSFFNSHITNVTGPLPRPFVRCHKASYVLLETVTAPVGSREGDTDGTCTAMRF